MRKILLGTLTFFTVLYAQAATLSVGGVEKDDVMCPLLEAKSCVHVRLEGEIERGDAYVLASKLRQFSKLAGHPIRAGFIYLSSPGGDVAEAMRLGRVFREHKIQTMVPGNSRCYSACVLALAGGVARLPMGSIGIHSFYSKEMQQGGFDYEKENARYQQMASEVSTYLTAMRIPVALLDEMIKTPPAMLKELTYEDQKRLGLFGYDPLFHQLLVTKGYMKPQ